MLSFIGASPYSLKNEWLFMRVKIALGLQLYTNINIISPDVQPSLCKFDGFFQLRRTFNGASPYGAHRSTDFHSRIMGFWNICFAHLPVFIQRESTESMLIGTERKLEAYLPMCIMVVHCSLPFSLVTRRTTYYITLKTMIFDRTKS